MQTDEFELDNIVSVEPDGFLKWEYDGNNFAVTTETYNGQPEEQLSILNGTTGGATAAGPVGEQATIHIRGKGAADSYRHWAELVIEVRTVDGTVLYAPLTPAMSSRFIIYRENKL